MKKRPNGSGTITQHGYVAFEPSLGKKKYEHIIIAERALGNELPIGVEVHHVDCSGINNAPSNLVICPDHAYHCLLHRRTRASDACGNANFSRCWICDKWDDPDNLKFHKGRPEAYHASCWAKYQVVLRLKRKEKRNGIPL